MFCDNDQCELNKVTDENRGLVIVGTVAGQKEVRNHVYAYGEGGSFYLCDTCRGAVEFARNKLRER